MYLTIVNMKIIISDVGSEFRRCWQYTNNRRGQKIQKYAHEVWQYDSMTIWHEVHMAKEKEKNTNI